VVRKAGDKPRKGMEAQGMSYGEKAAKPVETEQSQDFEEELLRGRGVVKKESQKGGKKGVPTRKPKDKRRAKQVARIDLHTKEGEIYIIIEKREGMGRGNGKKEYDKGSWGSERREGGRDRLGV